MSISSKAEEIKKREEEKIKKIEEEYKEKLEAIKKQRNEKINASKEIIKKSKTRNRSEQEKEIGRKARLRDLYLLKRHPEKYKEIYELLLNDPLFDKYLTRNHDRILFGLPPLKPKDDSQAEASDSSKTETPIVQADDVFTKQKFEPRPEGGIYLNVPRRFKEIAKPMGAKWDNPAQCWYVPEGVDPKPIQAAVDKQKTL